MKGNLVFNETDNYEYDRDQAELKHCMKLHDQLWQMYTGIIQIPIPHLQEQQLAAFFHKNAKAIMQVFNCYQRLTPWRH
jgi:hypothetical protein